ncbi:MAG: hypothetical protein PHQ19_10415 [Candidatus Krumholzibacteria bacterium]|nr:hypothetical protein [Candidatus Krumholzibacteria bacterium]
MTMMVWEAETTVIRLLAVALVLALLWDRGGRPGRWTAFSLLTFAACLVAHFMRGGAGDLASAVGGAATAAAMTVPLSLRGIAGRRVTAASIAAGSVFGPAGAAATLGIAAFLHLLGRIAGTWSDPFPDRFEIVLFDDQPQVAGSVLTLIEGGRFAGRARRPDSPRAGAADFAAGAIPLRITLAAAMLAALLTEAFI